MGGFRRAAVVGATVASLAALGSPVAAVGRSSAARTVSFTSSYDDPATRPSTVATCYGNERSGEMPYEGDATLVGALDAADHYCGFISYDALSQSVVGEGWDTLTGSLQTCDTGSFTIHQYDYKSGLTFFDPATNESRLDFVWDVVPGSGTGAFVGASGRGTGVAYFEPPTDAASPGIPNHGSYSGSVTCPHH